MIDLSAKDLMLGVKALNKQCKGAKRVYDFTSEFTHPNALALMLYATAAGTIPDHSDRAFVTKLEWPTESRINFTNLHFGKQLEDRFSEVLEVVGGCLDTYLSAEKQLGNIMKKIAVDVKKEIRRDNRLIEKQTGLPAIKKSELCPCYSGKLFGACCGQ